jgi:nitrate reductase NapD
MHTVSRRHLLTGQVERPDIIEAVASAVVTVLPARREAVISALAALPHTEIGPAYSSKIVLILEGSTRDEIGARLAQIAMMDGVLTANMVFEHAAHRQEQS